MLWVSTKHSDLHPNSWDFLLVLKKLNCSIFLILAGKKKLGFGWCDLEVPQMRKAVFPLIAREHWVQLFIDSQLLEVENDSLSLLEIVGMYKQWD